MESTYKFAYSLDMRLLRTKQSLSYNIVHLKAIQFVIFIMVFCSCEKIDNRLKVVNNSNRVLYYRWSSDSTFTNLFKEIDESRNAFKLDSIQVLRIFQKIEPRKDTITEIIFGTWENYLNKSQIKFIYLFIIEDSLSQKCIQSQSDLQKLVKKRKFYTIDYLIKNKWLIEIEE
jgi:hypothetical protein